MLTPGQDIVRASAVEDLEKIAQIATRNQLRAPPEMLPSLQAIAERAERAIRHLKRMEHL